MPWQIVTDNEIRHLGVPDKMFAYADSYLRPSIALCDELAQAFKCAWADEGQNEPAAPGCSQLPVCLSQLSLKTWRTAHRWGSSSNGFLASLSGRFALCLNMRREARSVSRSSRFILSRHACAVAAATSAR